MKIKVKITRQENASFFNCKINDVVEVDFEEYVAGVTASEIGNGHIEACKAQAVAARTFAASRNVLYGEVISDSSATAQAYRAVRYSMEKYPNAIKGTEATAGQMLFYNFKPITAVYGASNGGFTVSSQERWGSARPYLIAQKDPWDAATGSVLHGPGVGMSQKGCSYAAKHGVDYKKILSFYYPNTILGSNYSCEKEVEEAMSNVQKPTTTLKKGSSGEQVVWAQTMLNALGYDCGTVDGIYGSKTIVAAKNFQRENGLAADGVIGSKTSAVLWDKYQAQPTPPSPDPDPEKDWIEELRPQLEQLRKMINDILEKK